MTKHGTSGQAFVDGQVNDRHGLVRLIWLSGLGLLALGMDEAAKLVQRSITRGEQMESDLHERVRRSRNGDCGPANVQVNEAIDAQD